ncbi:hypothetical protein DEO72_LG10g2343 [Vigna unguiculata]|uniref:Rapid ALkalinization Factor n=1 Tax=Vigna unguiculata TaxID=3917 RepID=A0A4D6NB37_VIGUN|nr:hypothetical protein DEO72_LG10g2343 [Vigna unguiculata]
MKTILIAFLLFASLFISSTSTMARELKDGLLPKPPTPPYLNCARGYTYRSCSAYRTPPKREPPCSYSRNC